MTRKDLLLELMVVEELLATSARMTELQLEDIADDLLRAADRRCRGVCRDTKNLLVEARALVRPCFLLAMDETDCRVRMALIREALQ